MAARPIWTIEQLVERTTQSWPIRPRIWAVEELSHRAPERLRELAAPLLRDEHPGLVEAVSDRLAPLISHAEAADYVDSLEPSPQVLALLLRAGHDEGSRLARLHNRWQQWVKLNREAFTAWFATAPHPADPQLAAVVAHHMIPGSERYIAESALEFGDVAAADELGAWLHLGLTGMVRAFSEDAGTRGVAVLRSDHFEMPGTIKEAFQEIGSLPPYLPRKRFETPLRNVWSELLEQLPKDESKTEAYEFVRDVCIAAVTIDGPEASDAAIRLANRALAAGILRIGVDNAFNENPNVAERMDIWLSFAPASFTRANQLLLHPSLELGEVSEQKGIDLAVEAFARVPDSGLTAATELAWTALKRSDDPHVHSATIAEAMSARGETPESFEEMLFSDGYREMIALDPRAFENVVNRGLDHPLRSVWTTTVEALESSGDEAAAEILRGRFETMIHRDAAPFGARALAVLGDPEGLDLIVGAWAPDEPKLASFALSASEIVGRPIDDAIVREGEAAFADEGAADDLDFQDLDAAMKRLRDQFRAILTCTECGRIGRYDPQKLLVDERAAARGELEGEMVVADVVTCKFCGAVDQYEVHKETSFYLYPHLGTDVPEAERRVERARLRLSEGTRMTSATQALAIATELADRGDVHEKLDLMRVSGLFGQTDRAATLRSELQDEAPEALEEWENRGPELATDDEVADAMREASANLGRKLRNTRTRVSKVGRYGIAGCFVSDDERSPGVGLAVMRKMPRGRFALGWIAVHRETGEIPVVGVEMGIGRADVERMLDGWNGAPFRPAEIDELAQRFDRAIRQLVALGDVPEEMAASWPFFASIFDR